MEMSKVWLEVLVLAGSISASAFGLLKLLLNEQRRMNEHLLSALSKSLERQDETIRGFHSALTALNDSVKENSQTVERALERLRVTFSGGPS